MHRTCAVYCLALALTACDDGGAASTDASPPPADASRVFGADRDAAAPPDVGPTPDAAVGPDAATRPLGRAVLNEVDCRGRDFVEIATRGDQAVDLSGWTLTDDPGDLGRGFPLGGVLAPGAVLDLRRQTSSDDGFTFGIGCGSNTITLLDPSGAEADAVDVPEQPAAYTWGRLPDAEGAWAPTWPSRGEPNLPPTDPAAPLFDPARVFLLDLTLTAAARASLDEEPRTEVPATLAFDGAEPRRVHLRIKGRWGSMRSLDEKAALKLDLDDLDPDGALLGLTSLTLNNMVQDPSYLHEWLAYTIFRALGVAAPRVGYAWVTLDGEPMGLYAHVETPDDAMLDRWFPDTAHLYEGAYGQDLYPEAVRDFEVDEGDAGDRDDLATLTELLERTPAERAYATTAGRVDWPQVLAMMVTETYIGHWDGYGPTRNNYFLHFDDDGVLRLPPWGTDQTFDARLPLRVGEGRLLRRCSAAPACRAAYDDTLARLLGVIDTLDLEGAIAAQAAVLEPWIRADPRPSFPPGWAAAAQRGAVDFLVERRAEMGAELGCLRGPNPDPDGDGWACGGDCAPRDRTIFPGAPDLCGDGIDQDCSGEPDDTPDCLVCVPAPRGPHAYLICPSRREWQVARATCVEMGLDLAIAADAGELAWLSDAARAVSPRGYWLGLTDEAAEGDFRWVDGQPGDALPWAPNEPNDFDGVEDCVELIAEDAVLNDLPCWAASGFVCEAPCPPGQDEDGDGVPRCDGDCDDADPEVGRCD